MPWKKTFGCCRHAGDSSVTRRSERRKRPRRGRKGPPASRSASQTSASVVLRSSMALTGYWTQCAGAPGRKGVGPDSQDLERVGQLGREGRGRAVPRGGVAHREARILVADGDPAARPWCGRRRAGCGDLCGHGCRSALAARRDRYDQREHGSSHTPTDRWPRRQVPVAQAVPQIRDRVLAENPSNDWNCARLAHPSRLPPSGSSPESG